MQDRQLKIKEYYLLLILFFFSIFIRLINLNSVFCMNSFIPPDPDAAYHLRIIQLILNGHFQIPLYDYYSNFPSGALIYWPLGFDYVLSGLSLPVFLVFGTMTSVETFLSFLVPVLGAVNVLIIYIASKAFSSDTLSSFLSALLFSLFYFHYNYSNVGHIDHHIAESIIFSLCMLFYIRTIKKGSVFYSKLLGFTLGISLCFWNGAFIYSGIVAAGLFGIMLVDDYRMKVLRIWKYTFFYALIAGCISILLFNNYYRILFSTVYLSFFHMGLILLFYFFPAIFKNLDSLFRKQSSLKVLFIIAFVMCLSIAAWLIWISNGGVLFDFLLKSDRNALVVTESKDITQIYKAYLLQTLVVFIPILIYFLIKNIKTDQYPLYISFLIFLFIAVILGFSQVRFMIYLSIISSIIMSAFIKSMTASLSEIKKVMKYLVIGCYIFFMVVPPAYILYERKISLDNSVPDYYIKTLKPVLEWLRTSAPETDYYLTPDRKPAYGVLYPIWNHGHYICYQGKRPTVANAFGGGGVFEKSIETCLEVVFSKKETPVYNIMKKNQIRYLVLKDFKSFLPLFYKAETLGGSLDEKGIKSDDLYNSLFISALYEVDIGKVEGRTDTYSYSEELRQLFNYLETQPTFFDHFRLVFNSPYKNDKNNLPMSRIFEMVSGAEITGYGRPEYSYTAYMILKDNNGESFFYGKKISCDSTGYFSFIWPYNTNNNGDIKALTKLELVDTDLRKSFANITISENDVIKGRKIVVE